VWKRWFVLAQFSVVEEETQPIHVQLFDVALLWNGNAAKHGNPRIAISSRSSRPCPYSLNVVSSPRPLSRGKDAMAASVAIVTLWLLAAVTASELAARYIPH